MSASYLLVLGEREALAWVLRSARMAFSPTSRGHVDRLVEGDEVFLTTTRGCFHNPTRDRTRVIGRARVASPVQPLATPVELVGREFTRGCDLALHSLAGYLDGVELAPLVPQMAAFPDPDLWAMRMRRTLIRLPARDARLLNAELSKVATVPQAAVGSYLKIIKPVQHKRPHLRLVSTP